MEFIGLRKLLSRYVANRNNDAHLHLMTDVLMPYTDDPVNNNDGTVLSCGNHKWCCQPSAAAKTCDCGTGDGTFSIQAGVAHTIIGVTGLAFTSTDAIPISSASASSSTSSLAATATSSLSSSFSSTLPASSQSTSSPTTITATPSSGTGDLVGSASSTNSARPMGATYSSAFVAGMAVISAVVAAAITALIFYLVQRRRRQRAMRGDHIPTAIGTSNTNMQPPTSENLLQDDPGEYDRPFPTHNAGTDPGSRANRSRHSFGMVPDHDQGPSEQVSLLHPPALDPYARPPQDPNGLQEGLPMQGVPSASAPPSYRSNPRGSLRPRGNSYRALPRVPVPRRPDIAEDGQNGFSDGYR